MCVVKSLGSAVLVAATCTALVAGAAAPVGATQRRSVVSAHVSRSAVAGAVPAGATVSVVQTCPKGSSLARTATSQFGRTLDAGLDRRLRLASRELWVAGTVSRYRVTRRLSADRPVVLANAALCASTVPAGATTVTGRAATDLRVWGPAPARLELLNATSTVVADSADTGSAYATMVRAAGVAASRGSLPDAVRAVQEAVQDDELGAVVAVGQTRRRVGRGQFLSMRNSYTYRGDLTNRITEVDLGELTSPPRSGR